MSLENTAQETLNILKAGQYATSAGKTVEFLAAQQMAVKKTVLYTPQQSSKLLEPAAGTSDRQPQIEVTAETTQAAAHRLVRSEGCKDLESGRRTSGISRHLASCQQCSEVSHLWTGIRNAVNS